MLIHLRRCIERAGEGVRDDLVVLDLDLRNAFPSSEWSAIDVAVQERAPGLGPWTTWCLMQPAEVLFVCVKWITCNRGAEQCAPLGPDYCGLILLRCVEDARHAFREAGGWSFDCWYLDDGQTVLPARHADMLLREFDTRHEAAGGTRVANGAYKSIARMLSAHSDLRDVDWV